ncbi:unnamed protein product [Blepharisma stoltei]|uniref:Tetratricopeptide repeat protein n=1 Tax=Blepharisma stoltei TaxID=1481888 RepID=A0AAU9JGR5_9CILI|nr:unnamed protein product [Blepharisma stoltei]
MAKVSDSCCVLDATFISDCCQFKACPKHYLSDEAQGYKLKRINLPINVESKEILCDFMVTLKKELKSQIDILMNENSKTEDYEKYKEKLSLVSQALHECSRIYMLLIKKQCVEIKLILSPFEYFLTQPKEKALQYTKHHWDRNNLLEFCRSIKAHGFDFNYMKFEVQGLIHGGAFNSTPNQPDRLSDFYYERLLGLIYNFKYEKAYELCQSLKDYNEFYINSSSQTIKDLLDLFGKILEKIIKKEGYSQLEEQWKQLAANAFQTLSMKNPAYNSSENLGDNSFSVYLALNQAFFKISIDSNVSEHYLQNLCGVEWISQYLPENIGNLYIWLIGTLYYGNKNYSKSIEYFNKSIKYHIERLQQACLQNKVDIWDESLASLIENYIYLAKAHSALKNNKEIIEILNLVEFQCSETTDKYIYLAAVGEIYYLLNDFDKAYKKLWECIKLSNQKKLIKSYSYELWNLWVSLANIHVWRGDFAKSHQSLCNAKSLCSVLDPSMQNILKALGVFYLNRQWYDDALISFEKITNWWSNHDLIFAKFAMGIVYFWKLDYQKAWEFLNEAKEMMSGYTESYKNELFIANAYLGELCYLQDNLEDLDKYFSDAFELIDYYDILNIDMFLKSQSFVFNNFYRKSDYGKCEVILVKLNKILENDNHLKFRMPLYFIQWAKLYIAWNEKEEAEACLSQAEKLLNIDKISLFSKKSIKINELDCISDYIEIAKIYIYLFNISDESLQKAEKILKYAKVVVSEKRRNDQFSKLDIYYSLGDLYFKKQRSKKSKRYYRKLLDLQKNINHASNVERCSKSLRPPLRTSNEAILNFFLPVSLDPKRSERS